MNNTFSKFNVYDQIGYLMVGAIALLVVMFDLKYFYSLSVSFGLDLFLVWFVLAYFAGHSIQAISNVITDLPILNFLIKENKEDFNIQEKEILSQAKTYYGLKKQDNYMVWNLCYMLSNAKDITGQIQSFSAYYSLYRGWLVIFFLQSLFLIYRLISQNDIETLSLLLLSALFTYIFYKRSKRFWKYLRRKVLETFVIVKKIKL